MKRKIMALLLCTAMVISLLPAGVYAEDAGIAAEEAAETCSVTGIVVANERYAIDADPSGDTLENISVAPTGTDSGESVIYYETVSGARTIVVDRALDDDMLGTKVTVNFTADQTELDGSTDYMNIQVVGDVILHEDTVVYTVPALDVDIMPNGESTSNTEIRPYISFTADGAEHQIEMSSDVAKVAKSVDAQVDTSAACEIADEVNKYAYVLDNYDFDEDGDFVHPTGTEFIDVMGYPTLTQYRFVSVDGGDTYSYMFKLVDDLSGNVGYGYVTAYNRASRIIRIAGVPGLTGSIDLDEAAVDSDVYVDDMVVVYRENGKIVVKKVNAFNAAVEEFTTNGVMLNGEEYFAWIYNDNVAEYNTIFDYYSDNPDAMDEKTTYYTYNNLILEIDADASSVGEVSDYAVVLQSYYDADMDAAYVKLAFADNTEGTYKVGKLYTPKPADLTYAGNNRMIDFANNSAFGYVLKYSILSDGTVDLSAQDLKAVNDADSTLKTFRDGGEVTDGKFCNLYPYSDDTMIFAIYGNPGYYVDGTTIAVDTTISGYLPIKAKAYKLSELKYMTAQCIDNLYMASFVDGAIEYIGEGMGSYIVDTTTKANRYVVVGAMTVGPNTSGITYSSTDSLAYVVSATQRYNSTTKYYYAELTLINEDGLITATTIEDVKDSTGRSVLDSDIVGSIDGTHGTFPKGSFVRFGMNDEGKIDVIDTYDDWGSLTVDTDGIDYYNGAAAQGLYLVNLTGVRNDVVSFYDCYIEESSGCTLNDVQTSSLLYAEDGYSIIAIDDGDYAGNNLTFISKYTQYLPEAEGGNAVVYIDENGEIEKIFSFTPNYVVDGSLSDFDEIEEVTDGDLTWNFSYGAVTYYNEEKDIIKIVGATPVEGTYKLSDLVVKGDVASDTLVVCYKDGENCVVEAVEVVTGEIEEFISDGGVVVGGNTYYLWYNNEEVYGSGYTSFFEYWSDESGSFDENTMFYVHENSILEIEFDEAPAPIENYAVVLRSYYDADMDTAYVKLGFTDDTEGTYKVGKLYTPKPSDLTYSGNNLAAELSNNSLFGCVVEYSTRDDGSVDLSAQDFESIYAGEAESKTKIVSAWNSPFDDGSGVVTKTKFVGKYPYDDSSVVFALYGNPCMVKNGTDTVIDPTSADGYLPVKTKAYKLSELENLTGNTIPNLYIGDYLSGGAVIDNAVSQPVGSYVLNTTKSADNYVVAAAITIGETLADGRMAIETSPTLGYVVSAEQCYNVTTSKYYAKFTIISEDGKISTKTVDDVQNYSSSSMLDPSDGIGKLNSWIGRFVSYELNEDGNISVLDTADENGCSYDVKNALEYSNGQPIQGLYLVNLMSLRNDVLSFYDTDSDVNVKSEATISAELSENSCDIIAVDGDDYAGSMLSFISSRTDTLYAADGGNAVIYINEDGEVEKIFSFTDDEYATISYDLNGGTGEIASFTKRTGTDIALSTVVPTRENYVFKGWAESADATEAKYQPGDNFSGDADTTFYAVWEVNKYTLTYVVDGEEYKTCEMAYGDVITPEAEPEKEGYIFSGWSEIPETMPAENITITGTFTEIEIVDATGVELDKTALSLTEGKSETLTATVLPGDATNKNVTWKSSDTSVATVTNGKVYAIGAGSATITATTVDGGYEATCTVTVTESVEPMIYVSSARARAGETIEVVVSLKNNPGLAGLQLSCKYDSVFELIAIEKGTALENLNFTVSADLAANPVMLPWDGEVDDSSNGDIVKLTFKVKDDAEIGEYEIQCTPVSAYDYDLADVEINNICGVVTVVDYIPGDINDDENIDVKDVTVLRRYIAGGYNVTVVDDALDVNRDGSIDVKDVTVLRRYIAGGYGIELK